MCQLADRTVVVEAGHGSELTWVNVLGVMHSNRGIGVGWVTHDQHLDVLFGIGTNGRTLRLKDATVCRQQIAALHTFFSWHCPNEQRNIGVTKRNVWVVGHHYVDKVWKRTII